MPDAPLAVVPVFTPATPTAPAAVRPVFSAATPNAPLVINATAALVAPTFATLTNANILWTAAAAGPEGNDITIAITTPDAVTLVPSVSDLAVSVAAGAKFGMIISGVTTPNVNRTLSYAGVRGGSNAWSETGSQWPVELPDGVYIYKVAGAWRISAVANSEIYYWAYISDAAATPDGLTGWTIGLGTGQPTVTAAPPTKAQVIAAALATPAVAAVVVPSASGAVTAAVATLTATNLTGGSGVTAPLPVQPLVPSLVPL